ncbi:hypothetical protein [Oharaeibacter diazotrophicus]|uniref:AlpA family transcriptional regulator n=1 Tax=Oharaeibacter diazotrophicus TaxID=1920512 RepID=A0A4R6RGD6_9HYPH|nr:hypothetical protein [Oharaeibacter diazotrophicus]TDP85360.1 hypothetical protein EDD54_2213 [Oharaeibacter diazotrophicus]BBE74330.1 hypothetical protein OHA_1_03961 [Pleomorphomonas sp. SM30]GLS75979.1 hypothetical protein GCM10007904_13140 [Oharaeibacter diazotrophicus]
MAVQTINLRLTPRRLLKASEAAEYCGRSRKTFATECPVAPIAFPNGDRLYDMHDLDRWIDALKAGDTADDIVARLG